MKCQVDLNTATGLAERIRARLEPHCQRVELAGSIRRRSPTVGDLDLVAIPRRGDRPAAAGLFEEEVSLLDVELGGIVAEGKFKPVKGGERLKSFEVLNTCGLGPRGWAPTLELHITTPDRWGVIFAINTGPWEYSRWFVTPRCRGGGLRDGYHVHDGYLWRAICPEGVTVPEGIDTTRLVTWEGHVYEKVDTPQETDFFTYVEGGLRDPPQRRR